jgi:hypothetical protein
MVVHLMARRRKADWLRRGCVRRALLNEYKRYLIPRAKADAKEISAQTRRLRLRGHYPDWEMEKRPLADDGWGNLVGRHIYLQNKLRKDIWYIERVD